MFEAVNEDVSLWNLGDVCNKTMEEETVPPNLSDWPEGWRGFEAGGLAILNYYENTRAKGNDETGNDQALSVSWAGWNYPENTERRRL